MKARILSCTVSRWKNKKTPFRLVITEEHIEDTMFEVAFAMAVFVLAVSLVSLIGVIGNV